MVMVDVLVLLVVVVEFRFLIFWIVFLIGVDMFVLIMLGDVFG